MASAIVTRTTNITPNGDGATLELEVFFVGAGVREGGDLTFVNATFAVGDTPATMRTRMSSAVAAEAVRLGYPLASNAMILPSFQRG